MNSMMPRLEKVVEFDPKDIDMPKKTLDLIREAVSTSKRPILTSHDPKHVGMRYMGVEIEVVGDRLTNDSVV